MSQEVAEGGALLVRLVCTGHLDCAGTEGIDIRVERDGEHVDGETRVISSRTDWKGVAVDYSSAETYAPESSTGWLLASFRPTQPFVEGTYKAMIFRTPYDFTVKGTAKPFDLANAPMSFDAEAQWRPAGDELCCPVFGEGDCLPRCFGADGERRMLRMGVSGLPRLPGVALRLVPIDAPDADAYPWDVASDEDNPFASVRALFPSAQESYCARLEAWDLNDDTRQTREGCVEAPEGGRIGRTRDEFEELGQCTGPPAAGGWGSDVWGAIEAYEESEYPEVPEPIGSAWCTARALELNGMDPSKRGKKNVEVYDFYCDEELESASCSVSSSGRTSKPTWLVLVLAGAVAWRLGRRRTVRRIRAGA